MGTSKLKTNCEVRWYASDKVAVRLSVACTERDVDACSCLDALILVDMLAHHGNICILQLLLWADRIIRRMSSL